MKGVIGLAFMVLAALPAVAMPAYAVEPSANINDIRYTDDMWSEEFLGIEAENPIYLPENLEVEITPPPANDSPEKAEDIAFLFWLEKNKRSPDQVEKIITEQRGTTDLVFGLGEKIPQDVQAMVDEIRYESMRDLDYQLYRLKRKYKHPRPTQLAPELTLVIPIPGSPAYPSGHAGIAWMGGLVYSYIDPKNAGKYMQYAGDVGLRRCISGIHYLVDGAGGRELADKVFKLLLDVPAYKQKLDAAKKAYEDSEVGKNSVAVTDEINSIRYPREKWNPEFVQALKDGPMLLDRNLKFSVAPYPPNGSTQTQAELDLLREYQKNRRTSEEIKKIHDENGDSTELLTGGPLIRQFDKNASLQALWPKAYADITYFLMVYKMEHLRARPTQLASDLTTVIDVPLHASYPSGHAAHTRLLADILGAIDEKNALEYKKMALDIGRRREIAGLHYPSDTHAGITLADAVFEKLIEVPEFKNEINKAKEEFLRMEKASIN